MSSESLASVKALLPSCPVPGQTPVRGWGPSAGRGLGLSTPPTARARPAADRAVASPAHSPAQLCLWLQVSPVVQPGQLGPGAHMWPGTCQCPRLLSSHLALQKGGVAAHSPGPLASAAVRPILAVDPRRPLQAPHARAHRDPRPGARWAVPSAGRPSPQPRMGIGPRGPGCPAGRLHRWQRRPSVWPRSRVTMFAPPRRFTFDVRVGFLWPA